jgi:hypothetical protein
MSFDVNRYSKELIAKKDIICYKTVYKTGAGTMRSLVQNFEYRIGGCYKLKGGQRLRADYYTIDTGFHSYKRLPNPSASSVIVRCIIPMGAKYWKNEVHFVSNKLFIKEFVK